MTTPQDRSTLAEIWQRRFAFYDQYAAAPTKEEANAIFRAGSFWTRIRLTSNFLAFFFGPIYFFVKGMWRKGLVLLGITVSVEHRAGSAGSLRQCDARVLLWLCCAVHGNRQPGLLPALGAQE